MTEDHHSLYAIAEAERCAAAFERPFSRLLVKHDGFTPELVDIYAREFMVARSLSWSCGDPRGKGSDKNARAFKKEQKAKKIRPFASLLNALSTTATTSLAGTFEQLLEQIRHNDLWKNHAFPSALSKFYMARSDWWFLPFDNHAARCLNAKGRSKTDQAIAFYTALDAANACETIVEINRILVRSGLSISASRVIDKYLLTDEFGFQPIAEAFAKTMSPGTQASLREAATETAPLLGELLENARRYQPKK